MPNIRLALTVLSTAMTLSRHPLVRAGVKAVASNPRTRDAAVGATRIAAYTAGRIVRILSTRRPS